jgi:hypothetical protein
MLNHLGVPMGVPFLSANRANPKGFFEDRGLRRIRMICGNVQFPDTRPFAISFRQRMRLLGEWATARSAEGAIIGGKMPAFGLLVREMEAAWRGRWRAIVTDRAIADCAASRHRFHRGQSLSWIADGLSRLAEQRDADLARLQIPTLRIQYSEMMDDPSHIVELLTGFCEIQPRLSQRRAAIRFVDPTLNHYTRRTST